MVLPLAANVPFVLVTAEVMRINQIWRAMALFFALAGSVIADPITQGMFSVTFDDGWISQHTLGRSMLQTNNVRATFYLNVNPFGGYPSFMQTNHVWNLIADGHEIGSHTVSHANLVNASDSNLVYELAYCREFLTNTFALGGVPSFAAPYGEVDERVITAISNHYANHRGVEPGLNWRDTDVLLLYGTDVNRNTQAQMLSLIDKAQANNAWIILVAHKLVSGEATEFYQYNVDDLAYLIQYAQSNGLENVTVVEGVALMDQLSLESLSTSLVIDDFEEGDLAEWNHYVSAGSSVQKSTITPGADSSQWALRIAWDLATPIENAFGGVERTIASNVAAFTEGLSLVSRGDGFTLSVALADAPSNAPPYQAQVGASGDWQPTIIPWSRFTLPSWWTDSNGSYPFDPAAASRIEINPLVETASSTNDLDDIELVSNIGIIDDFEDFNSEGWYTYADDGGSVMQTNIVMSGAMGSFGAWHLEWSLGTNTYPYAGAGRRVSSNVAAVADGISIASKGSDFLLVVKMAPQSVTNDASYQVRIPASDEWRTSIIPWSAFTLPSWSDYSEAEYPLVPEALSHIELSNPDGLSAGTNEIDDVEFILNDLGVQADLDGDRMPDSWELVYIGDTTVSDGSGDQDGDGILDLLEYELGTDPDYWLAPAWWSYYGVINTNANVVTNDYAAVNQGQIKWMATKAYEAMESGLPNGAGSAVASMVTGFSTSNNYAAVNIGQAKMVAKPFYDRFGELQGVTNYPWGGGGQTNDYGLLNTGQLKNLFRFEIAVTNGVDAL